MLAKVVSAVLGKVRAGSIARLPTLYDLLPFEGVVSGSGEDAVVLCKDGSLLQALTVDLGAMPSGAKRFDLWAGWLAGMPKARMRIFQSSGSVETVVLIKSRPLKSDDQDDRHRAKSAAVLDGLRPMVRGVQTVEQTGVWLARISSWGFPQAEVSTQEAIRVVEVDPSRGVVRFGRGGEDIFCGIAVARDMPDFLGQEFGLRLRGLDRDLLVEHEIVTDGASGNAFHRFEVLAFGARAEDVAGVLREVQRVGDSFGVLFKHYGQDALRAWLARFASRDLLTGVGLVMPHGGVAALLA